MNAPGLFVTVDGPGGVGKSTVLTIVADALRAKSVPVHATTEPSRTPLGDLIRASTDTHRGLALAHLVAGDRHHHVTTDILPRCQAGDVVLCDRYIPSSLVLQRMDGIPQDLIWQMNAGLPVPDLAVILTAAPASIEARMSGRGSTHSRFERMPGAAHTETTLYHDAAGALSGVGWPVHVIDTTDRAPDEVGRMLHNRIVTLYAARRSDD